MFRLAVASSMGILAGCLMLLVAWFFVAPEASAAPTYQQVVDNSTKGRFKANTGWTTSTYSSGKYGRSYKAAKPGRKGLAQYKTRTPRTGYYTVCGRWPANSGYNARTPIQIQSTSGWKIKRVNQQRNGGKWVKVGTYRLGKGDAYKIRVTRRSSSKGYLIADAFKIRKATSSRGVACTTTKPSGSSKPKPRPSSSSAQRGDKVAREALKYEGTPYGPRAGGLAECIPYKRMDCSCLILTAYKKAVNISLPDDPARIWNYGRKVDKLQRGDIVFYKEDGRSEPITHAGIYLGNGYIVHASNYYAYREVVRTKMRWPGDGYYGARRLV